MDLESITEISWAAKDIYHMIYSYVKLKKKNEQKKEIEKQIVKYGEQTGGYQRGGGEAGS